VAKFVLCGVELETYEICLKEVAQLVGDHAS
jgi:hypothetical protein